MVKFFALENTHFTKDYFHNRAEGNNLENRRFESSVGLFIRVQTKKPGKERNIKTAHDKISATLTCKCQGATKQSGINVEEQIM